MKNEIILFENQNVKLEVNMKDETVWLLLEQLATLFDRNRTVIKRHINNILKEKELKTIIEEVKEEKKEPPRQLSKDALRREIAKVEKHILMNYLLKKNLNKKLN